MYLSLTHLLIRSYPAVVTQAVARALCAHIQLVQVSITKNYSSQCTTQPNAHLKLSITSTLSTHHHLWHRAHMLASYYHHIPNTTCAQPLCSAHTAIVYSASALHTVCHTPQHTLRCADINVKGISPINRYVHTCRNVGTYSTVIQPSCMDAATATWHG